MSKRKGGLGRGLDSLLSNSVTTTSSSGTEMVAIDKLSPNPYQPRKTFDDAAIQALSDSIRQHGIIQPLAVRICDDGYEIIAGERRYRASKLAELTEVPVVIHDISDTDSAVFALIENLQREDLNVIEKAAGIAALIDNFNLTHEACGEVLGQSRSSISNTLRLLDLSKQVQQAVIDKLIDMGHARALLPLEQAEQYELLQQIRLRGLSVRETEDLVRDMQGESENPPQRAKKNSAVKKLETRLSESLQTRVNISQKSTGDGKITLSFSDAEMLAKLVERLGLSM